MSLFTIAVHVTALLAKPKQVVHFNTQIFNQTIYSCSIEVSELNANILCEML